MKGIRAVKLHDRDHWVRARAEQKREDARVADLRDELLADEADSK